MDRILAIYTVQITVITKICDTFGYRIGMMCTGQFEDRIGFRYLLSVIDTSAT